MDLLLAVCILVQEMADMLFHLALISIFPFNDLMTISSFSLFFFFANKQVCASLYYQYSICYHISLIQYYVPQFLTFNQEQ